tara:strand:+ start:126 stop:320 length:195 start_codon:yes stop_codon:yes gene_type:complete
MSKSLNQGVWGNGDSTTKVGDWDDIPATEWSVRAKNGITDLWPDNTWDDPNPIKKVRVNKGPYI